MLSLFLCLHIVQECLQKRFSSRSERDRNSSYFDAYSWYKGDRNVRHNYVAERICLFKEKVKAANHRIEDLERKVV